jgi:serine protease inhibitor
MERRTFLGLLGSPVVLAMLQACGSNAERDTREDADVAPHADLARSDAARETPCLCDATEAAAAVNAFGLDLYRSLAGGSTAPNLVFSPTSIAIALAMTRAGAVGATATEMDAVLHIADPASLAPAMNAMTASLDERTQTIVVPGGDDIEIRLTIANSLWGQSGFPFEQPFLDVLASEYGAGVELVDFRGAPQPAGDAINTWVDDATEGRIPTLLAPDSIDPLTRLVLVNAIYMKAPWLAPFAKAATTAMPFTTPDGTTVQGDMMRRSAYFPYATGDGWTAVELPYSGNLLSMLLVLPDQGKTPAEVVTAFEALAAPDALANRQVMVGLPKFDTETSVGLGDVLAALGMPRAFSDQADFTAMTTAEPLAISAVIHQANITVDEDGTEAAAATAVMMEATGMPVEPVELTFDRPFLFAIRDRPTGAILFLGHIADPTT